MGENFRLVILCSEDRSDLFFANKLAERFDPVGIFVESQRADPSAEPALQKYLRLAKAPHQMENFQSHRRANLAKECII